MIVVVSDMSGISQDLFNKPKYPLKFLQVGEPDKNVAITDFTIAGTTQTPQGTGVNAFLVVKNYLPKPVSCNVEFDVDGALADVRTIDVEGGARTSKLFKDVPYSPAQGAPGVIQAKLQYEDDLPLDNVAYAIPSTEQTMTVLQVGDDPFLTLALGGLPGIRLFKIKQEQYSPGGDFDLTFFADWAPATLPEGNYVFFNPPDRDYLPVAIKGQVKNPKVTDWTDGHPLLRFVNPGSFDVFNAEKLEPKAGSLNLIDGDSTPLMVYGERNYVRAVVFPFNLASENTDLMTRPTFPILIMNLVSFYRSYMDSEAAGLRTEGIMPVKVDQLGAKVKVTGPNGFDREFDIQGGHAYIDVDKAGIYTMAVEGAGESSAKTIVANYFDESESDISSITQVAATTEGGGSTRFDVNAERRIWKWLSIFALFVLTIEWTFYHRKGF